MNTSLKLEWQQRESTDLIEFIIHHFHQSHRQILPQLISRSEALELLHSDDSLYPKELTSSLKQLRNDLFEHMEKEEIILFPLLSSHSHHYLCTQLHKAEHNHQEHKLLLDKIELMTNQFHAPKADTECSKFYADIKEFFQEMRQHMMLEEEVLFNREDSFSTLRS